MKNEERPRVRVMWEWHAFPVWGVGDVVVDDLRISEPLRHRLQAWSDSRTNAGGSILDGWEDDGRRLVRDLQRELGDSVIVGYRNDKTGLDQWPEDDADSA